MENQIMEKLDKLEEKLDTILSVFEKCPNCYKLFLPLTKYCKKCTCSEDGCQENRQEIRTYTMSGHFDESYLSSWCEDHEK